jgi:hypothetical protein
VKSWYDEELKEYHYKLVDVIEEKDKRVKEALEVDIDGTPKSN